MTLVASAARVMYVTLLETRSIGWNGTFTLQLSGQHEASLFACQCSFVCNMTLQTQWEKSPCLTWRQHLSRIMERLQNSVHICFVLLQRGVDLHWLVAEEGRGVQGEHVEEKRVSTAVLSSWGLVLMLWWWFQVLLYRIQRHLWNLMYYIIWVKSFRKLK